jgi:hypothetical protein
MGMGIYSLQVEKLPKAPACAEASAGRPPKPGQQELI